MKHAFRKLNVFVACAFLTLVLAPPYAHSGKKGGVEMAESISLDGKDLVLNGMGMRKATILAVKVYTMGLYLENKSQDDKAIINSRESKRIVMHFVRDVSADKLNNAWQKGFEKNFSNVAGVQKQLDAFKASMSDVRKGESIILDFVGDKVSVNYDGSHKASIEGEAFQRGLLSVWLGSKPPNKSLKRGILGVKRKSRTNRRG